MHVVFQHRESMKKTCQCTWITTDVIKLNFDKFFLNSKYIKQIISFQCSKIMGQLRTLHINTVSAHRLIFRAVPGYFKSPKKKKKIRICCASSHYASKKHNGVTF